jgi:hypothetical protein
MGLSFGLIFTTAALPNQSKIQIFGQFFVHRNQCVFFLENLPLSEACGGVPGTQSGIFLFAMRIWRTLALSLLFITSPSSYDLSNSLLGVSAGNITGNNLFPVLQYKMIENAMLRAGFDKNGETDVLIGFLVGSRIIPSAEKASRYSLLGYVLWHSLWRNLKEPDMTIRLHANATTTPKIPRLICLNSG